MLENRKNCFSVSNSIVACCFILVLGITASCDKNKPTADDFDRKPLLENYANNLIIPSWEEMSNKSDSLYTAANTFAKITDLAHLELLKESLLQCMVSYSKVSAFGFGPAESSTGTFNENVGTFPANVTKIENYISSGNSSHLNFDRDSRGLNGIDYLISHDNPNAVITEFSSDSNRMKYLLSAIEIIRNDSRRITSEWKTSYAAYFISNTGTASGSSTSLLYNNFILNYEISKNYRLGLPLGKMAGQTTTEPNRVEAYYNGKSILLLKEQFLQTERLFYGLNLQGTNGKGFDDYLKALDGGDELLTQIEEQFTNIDASLNSLPDSKLSDLIIGNDPKLSTLHTEFQKLTRFIKSDMSSLLGISITFSSGDGD